jgi:hypothetical protein
MDLTSRPAQLILIASVARRYYLEHRLRQYRGQSHLA